MDVVNEKIINPLLTAVQTADNRLSQSVKSQTMKIDDDWVKAIEDTMHSLENIAENPKSFIRDAYELVNVEKARKVDSYALRHLSGHTEYVRTVSDDGSVIPKKVMNKHMDTDMAIYENRVVYALILRLVEFVEQRYEKIVELSKIKDRLTLTMDSNFTFGDCRVNYGLTVSIEKPAEDTDTTDVNDKMLARLENIRIRLKSLQYSSFAREMAQHKSVVSPISKTNIFSGNIDYGNCYKLWAYLSGFDTLGFGVTVREKNLPFDDAYFDGLVDVEMSAFKVILENDIARSGLYSGIKFTTKKEKRYREVKKVNFELNSPDGKMFDEGDIGQYYYDKIMSLTKEISSESKAGDVEAVKGVPTNLRRFYKGLVNINNKMVDELLHKDSRKKTYKSNVEKLNSEYAEDKQELKKLELLEQLKYEEYLLSKKKTERQTARLAESEAKISALKERIALKKQLKKEKQLADKEAARKKAELKKQRALKIKKNAANKSQVQKKKRADRQKEIALEAAAAVSFTAEQEAFKSVYGTEAENSQSNVEMFAHETFISVAADETAAELENSTGDISLEQHSAPDQSSLYTVEKSEAIDLAALETETSESSADTAKLSNDMTILPETEREADLISVSDLSTLPESDEPEKYIQAKEDMPQDNQKDFWEVCGEEEVSEIFENVSAPLAIEAESANQENIVSDSENFIAESQAPSGVLISPETRAERPRKKKQTAEVPHTEKGCEKESLKDEDEKPSGEESGARSSIRGRRDNRRRQMERKR